MLLMLDRLRPALINAATLALRVVCSAIIRQAAVTAAQRPTSRSVRPESTRWNRPGWRNTSAPGDGSAPGGPSGTESRWLRLRDRLNVSCDEADRSCAAPRPSASAILSDRLPARG